MSLVARLARDEQGATAIEYGLIVAFIALGTIATLRVLGGSVSDSFTAASDAFVPTDAGGTEANQQP